MGNEQKTLFDKDRQTMSEAIEQTIESMCAYGPLYKHWVIANR